MMTTEEYNDKPTGSNDGRNQQMTDLIPRDAAIEAAMNVVVFSPRASQSEIYAAVLVLARVETALVAVPAIDPAAIREAALREAAAKCAEHAEAARKKLGAAQTREEANAWALIVTRCDLLEEAILALIGEKK